jgi:hypothetical protein
VIAAADDRDAVRDFGPAISAMARSCADHDQDEPPSEPRTEPRREIQRAVSLAASTNSKSSPGSPTAPTNDLASVTD